MTLKQPNHVAIMADVPDLDALLAALKTPDAAAAMNHDGVQADSLVFLSKPEFGEATLQRLG